MTTKQQLFIYKYIENGFCNASKAAREAGYSEKTSRHQAARLLANVNIRRILQQKKSQLTASIEKEIKISKAAIAQKWAQIGLSPTTDSSTKDQLKATELLAKHLGMFDLKTQSELTPEEKEAKRKRQDDGIREILKKMTDDERRKNNC